MVNRRFAPLSLSLVIGTSLALGCTGSKKNQSADRAGVEGSADSKPAGEYKPPGLLASEKVATTKPKRIILFIGDGMGVPAVTAGAYAKGAPLEMMQMPHVSFMRTHEYEFVTTDSAASATAFATGHKTHFEGVSVKPGTTVEQEADHAHHLSTMIDAAKKVGWKTGLVATSRIVHATPAAFAAHRKNRGSYEEIALDMSSYGVDVLLGAGSKFFNKRSDKIDLLASMKADGYTIATTRAEVLAASGKSDKLVGLLHEKDMPPMIEGGRVMSLAELTDAAIKTLDEENPEGYFLMVEGSQIDWEEHAMNGEGTVAEVLDFDEAVGVARRYASAREDTLVIVTADHETGGLAILDPPSAKSYLDVLGGMEEATASVASSDPGRPYPPPVQPIPLGDRAAFGPAESALEAFYTTFGFLSVASRQSWTGKSSSIATHTATMVPIFAQGAGARELAEKVQDNADLGRYLKASILSGQAGALDPVERAILDVERDTFTSEIPKNVIILIGDGMGVAAVTAGYYASGGSAMMTMPHKGLVSTHAVDRVVNDSAATATAIATGKRTRYGSVGMSPVDGELVASRSVLELAEEAGLRTGLVTTTTLTHATPGAFYAHMPNRRDEVSIAQQFANLHARVLGSDGVDVAFGGGEEKFSAELIADLRKRGVYYSTRWEDTPAPSDRQVLRLLAPRGLPSASDRMGEGAEVPPLSVMTESALETLSGAEEGFFLMVEGGQIDWAQHGLDTGQTLIDEITDFDGAVAAALAFARERGDTLVIVTADHDHTLSLLDNHYGFAEGQCGAAKRCGGSFEFNELPVPTAKIHRGEGLSASDLQGADYAQPGLLLQYAWLPQAASLVKKKAGPHSANFVPLFAYGPGAANFSGYMDQPTIGQRLLEWATNAGK